MEEPAVLQEKTVGSWEGGHDGGKAEWKNERSLSSLLKHSCLLCWSAPRDPDVMETDDRVLAKAAEISELENAVALENLELQEQQSDRKELEETLVKLEKHKETLLQQIQAVRQLCYEESQQILTLQADEMQKESQVEEYERELARARWRLRNLREEVNQAKRKVDEAGQRNTPLQDSIRQSYEDILQEEHILCSLSGSAVTPESQLDDLTFPADTADDDPLHMKPWGRSQSLPAYADLIMRASSSSFCNSLAGTREVDNSGANSSKMERSDIEDDPEDGEIRGEEEVTINANLFSQLDFYQADPFTQCQNDNVLFNEDLFPKTDSSDGFAADPFRGSDPFAADVLFAEVKVGAGDVDDEGDASLSCTENKASTGTQCFESEFPDEGSDIEISYSREDLDAIAVADDHCGFKPIQSPSQEMGTEPIKCWRSQGQYSVESDPNGYELDLGAISPPPDIEEHSLGSLAGDANPEAAGPEPGVTSGSAQTVPLLKEQMLFEPGWRSHVEQSLTRDVTPTQGTGWVGNTEEEPRNSAAPQNSLASPNLFIQPQSDLNRELNFELSYKPVSQSFDPYGFKLSPEHSSHTLLDSDEADLTPELAENNLNFDTEPSHPQPDQLDFDPYRFDITSSHMTQDFDPYGFKLSPDEENQEVMDHCGNNPGVKGLCSNDNKEQVGNCCYSNLEVLEPHSHENQEVLDLCNNSQQEPLGLFTNGNQEALELSSSEHMLCSGANQEVTHLCSHENQEVVETTKDLLDPCNYVHGDVLEPCSHGNREMLNFTCAENQEVLDLDNHGDQELLDFRSKENQEGFVLGSHDNQELLDHCSNEDQELLDLSSHDYQEVLAIWSKEVLPEANNNQCIEEPKLNVSPTNNSSDNDVASDDLLALELSNTSICTSNKNNTNTPEPLHMAVSNKPVHQDFGTSHAPSSHSLFEGDLGSVFVAGGYISCPDVADDLEPLDSRQANTTEEPVQPVRPVRPPRPSLRAKEKAQLSQTHGIDLK